jgi:hypothetical protein
VARQTSRSGAQHLTITSQHAQANKAQSMLTTIHALINQFKLAAEQLKTKSVWQLPLRAHSDHCGSVQV